jgi:hypothetical protein
MNDTERLAALLHAEDCWPECGEPQEVPAGSLFQRQAARLIAAGVTLAATPAPLNDGKCHHTNLANDGRFCLDCRQPLATHALMTDEEE